MRARAVLTDGAGRSWLDEVEVDEPGPGEVRVRLHAAGVCHTDLDSLRWGRALVMGHEGAGRVEAIGDGVTTVRCGDAVVLNWAMPCGACRQCRRGNAFLCASAQAADAPEPAYRERTRWKDQTIGRSFDLGTFAEWALVPESAVTLVPEGVPMASACLVGCAVMTGVGSVLNAAQVQRGDSVAVLGCGSVGLNVVQGARLAGAATIIAIDTRAERLRAAQRLGATHTFVATEGGDVEALAAQVRALTAGEGADHAFEATGRAGLAFAPLLLVRPGGQALQLSGHTDQLTVPGGQWCWNKRYQVPLYGNCVPARDFPLLFGHYLAGRIELNGLIGCRYTLDQVPQAMRDLEQGRVSKAVVEIGGTELRSH